MKETILISILLLANHFAFDQPADSKLSFSQPAQYFEESIPMGNGKLGAMIFGNPNHEKIVLNEISLWSGGVQDSDNDSARHYLPAIRGFLMNGENRKAQELLQEHFVARGAGSGFGNAKNLAYGCYQTMGELGIAWSDTLNEFNSYQRVLDLGTAISITSWTRNNVRYMEESFISANADVLAVRLSASRRGMINFTSTLNRKEHAEVSARRNGITVTGQLINGDKPGMRFASALLVANMGGSIVAKGNTIEVKNADECILYWTAETDYNYDDYTKSGLDPLPIVMDRLAKAQTIPFEFHRKNHIQAFSRLSNSTRFFLSSRSKLPANITTPQRLQRYAKMQSDPQLPVLYHNFGRYLLISSSRNGLLPANLQGLWAEEYQTPWNGDYHLNINLQMNYWLAETMALGKLAEPLHAFTESLVRPGKKTAKAYYDAPGWVAHVISNPWRFTSPGEGAHWGSTLTGGAWLCRHLWDHFEFTLDTAFLGKYYPVLKGAAEFLASILVEEPTNHWLVTAPSNSPENTYVMPDGFRGQTCMGPTMDMQICREIFDNCMNAAKILQIDHAWTDKLDSIRKRLAPTRIGSAGDINEWLHDWPDAEPLHRHVSHLYGLYPYDEITPWSTPELAGAARKTLTQRGDGGTGWSRAWKINFWARLGDGDHAFLLLRELLQPVHPNANTSITGGTYPNLFCAHPPFQIDGNFGGAAGITEMLLQSHGENHIIRPLPALPAHEDWKEGGINGWMARGGFALSFQWKDHKLRKGTIYSSKAGVCRILLPPNFIIKEKKGRVVARSGREREVLEFDARKNMEYRFGPAGRKSR